MSAVQLATMAGARVTATVRDPAAREHIAALGVMALEPAGFEDHGPFDVILELVGGPNIPGNLKALANCGRICVIGVGAGAKVELNLLALMGKRARIHGSVLRPRSLEDKAAAARRVERAVLPGFASGDLSVPVTATFPLDAVADAYERFAAGAKLGKIVLEI
jgi:NADPH:quinone reductase